MKTKELAIAATIIIGLTVALFAPLLVNTHSIAGNAGDVYLHYYPLHSLCAEQVQAGNMPLWNPYIFAGQPLLANPQSAVFYPMTLLFYILSIPVAFNYTYILHFILAGFGMYLCARSLKLVPTAALLCSIAFTFSSFLVYKVPAGHPAALAGYVWFPWIILLIHRTITIAPVNYSYALLTGALFALQYLSGHIHPILISVIFLFIYVLAYRLLNVKTVLVIGGGALFIAAVQFVPSNHAERSIWDQLAIAYSMPLKNLITMIHPGYFGTIMDNNYVMTDNPSYFYELCVGYFGVIPLIAALIGIVVLIRKKQWHWIIVIATGFFLTLGFTTSIYAKLFSLLPGFSLLRVPARFYFMALTGLILAAGYGWMAVSPLLKKSVKILLMVLVIVEVGWWAQRFIYAQDIRAYQGKSQFADVIDNRYRVITQPDIIASNKSMLHHYYNLNGYETIMLQDFSRYLGLQEKGILGSTGLARDDMQSPLFKGMAVGYYITKKPMNTLDHISTLENGIGLYRNPKALPIVYIADYIHAQYYEDVYEQMEYLRKTENTPKEEILIDRVPKDFPLASTGGKITKYTQAQGKISLEVELPSPAAVVFSQIYYSGWRAWAAKKETTVYRGNKVLPVILLNKGKYIDGEKIVLKYMPNSFMIGLLVTISMLLAMMWLLARGVRRFVWESR